MNEPNQPILYYRKNSSLAQTYSKLLQQLYTGPIVAYEENPSFGTIKSKSPWLCFFSPITLGTIELLTSFLESTKLYPGSVIIGAIGTSPPRPGMEEELTARHLSYDQRTTRRIFYLQGGYNQYDLGFVRRFSLSLLAWKDLIQLWKKQPMESEGSEESEGSNNTNAPVQLDPPDKDHWSNTGKTLFIPKPVLLEPMITWIRSIETQAPIKDN